jgi:outer membrane protein OmpA-like peptidoglycan-associated protein
MTTKRFPAATPQALAVIAALIVSPAALAGDQAVSVGLFGGALFTDQLEALGDAPLVAPRIGYWLNPTLGIELDVPILPVAQTQVGTPDTFPYFATVPTLNLVGRVFEDEPISLMLSMGVGGFVKKVSDDGALDLPTRDNIDLDFAGVAGPGFLVPIGKFAIRTDYRWVLNAGTENWQNRGDTFLSGMWTLGLMYLPTGEKDTDKDGIADDVDQCVDQAEDTDGFNDIDGCPDLDNDQDGVNDDADACKDQPEDKDKWEDENGCPDPDNDGDTVLDGDDRCRNVAGTVETSGCPDADGDLVIDRVDECVNEAGSAESFGCPDRDGDLVPDVRDECPDQKAPPGIDPSRADGCPRKFYIAKDKIVILDQVRFQTGKAVIQSVSFELLNGVASTLVKYPGITLIQVEGHTDNQGADEANLTLSQARADSVKAYLAGKGVAEARMVAKGFGETKPVADNATADGRQQNRRVEFNILEQDLGTKEVTEDELPAEQ